MKHIVPTLVVAPDELSRAGLLSILANRRYKPMPAKYRWETVIASGKPPPPIAILILSGTMIEPGSVTSKIEAMAAHTKVVVLADHCDAKLVRTAMCAGAVGYLPRSISGDTLIQTLDLVIKDEVIFPASVLRGVLTCTPSESEPSRNGGSEGSTPMERMDRLSSREIEILRRLVHGDSNKQISRQLEISETTVKVHVKAILRKVRVRNRTQAAIWGLDRLASLPGVPPALPGTSSRIGREQPLIQTVVVPVAVAAQQAGSVRGIARS